MNSIVEELESMIRDRTAASEVLILPARAQLKTGIVSKDNKGLHPRRRAHENDNLYPAFDCRLSLPALFMVAIKHFCSCKNISLAVVLARTGSISYS